MNLEEYLKKQMERAAACIDEHADKKGRHHHNVWNFYMGRFCAFEEMLVHVSGKSESEVLAEFIDSEKPSCTNTEGSVVYGTKTSKP